MSIIIRGDFTVEGDLPGIDNMVKHLSYLELESRPLPPPIVISRFTSIPETKKKKKEYSKMKEMIEIELIEDVWGRCKAHGWDKGELWNKQIAPHKPDTLVRVVTQIMPKYKIISVEEVTEKMIEEATGGA